MGQPLLLQPGDLCYYWRDTPPGSAAKLKWRGPATVIMREPGPHGPHTDVYWIGHGTVLLRAAPEHIKAATPIHDLTETGHGQTSLEQHQESWCDTLHRPQQKQQATPRGDCHRRGG